MRFLERFSSKPKMSYEQMVEEIEIHSALSKIVHQKARERRVRLPLELRPDPRLSQLIYGGDTKKYQIESWIERDQNRKELIAFWIDKLGVDTIGEAIFEARESIKNLASSRGKRLPIY